MVEAWQAGRDGAAGTETAAVCWETPHKEAGPWVWTAPQEWTGKRGRGMGLGLDDALRVVRGQQQALDGRQAENLTLIQPRGTLSQP